MNDVLNKTLNYYNILQIETDATVTQIKKAYKKLVLKYHPDVNKEESDSEKFKEITKAYNVLKDNELRTEYDIRLQQNISFLHKIDFEYCYHAFIRKKEKIFNIFKIIFKNITMKKDDKNINKMYNNNAFFDYDIEFKNELLEISVEELEERLLYSENTYVRVNAAIALGYKNEKKTYSSLEKMLNDPNDEVKKSVIWAIGNLRMKNSISLLKILFNSNKNSLLKYEILKAIYKISGSKTSTFYEMMISTINDKNEENKIGALNLLLQTDRKILYDDIKGFFINITTKTRTILDKVISENRIINYPKENT
jgi:curved DNA-binding protein CbpA